MVKPRVICLMGPTASGKTRLAMALCDTLPVEIISVDSAMVYRGMDIGSAKPTAEELAKYPHRLIDLCDPSQAYNAADFCRDAVLAIQEVQAKGKIPLLVGGTMLYFHSLQQGLSPLPPANAKIRATLEAEAAEKGWAYLHQRLAGIDPAAAERIHPNDPQRLQRALEVYELTGKPLSECWQAGKQVTDYDFINIALMVDDRETLQQLIAQRFDAMLAQGFLTEVKSLRAREDLNADLPALRAVGYRQAWQYLNDELSLPQLRERAIIATRQLAKRQLTWLRKWESVQAFDYLDPDLFMLVRDCLQKAIFN